MRKVAGIGQTREDVLSGKPRIIGQDLALRLPGGQQLKYELDCYTSPSDYWLATQDLGINNDAFRPGHESIIQPWILWLTIVGVTLAAVGVGIAVVQLVSDS